MKSVYLGNLPLPGTRHLGDRKTPNQFLVRHSEIKPLRTKQEVLDQEALRRHLTGLSHGDKVHRDVHTYSVSTTLGILSTRVVLFVYFIFPFIFGVTAFDQKQEEIFQEVHLREIL